MRAMRLLVIEDEPKLADYLHKGLSENGHVVDVARDGIQGRLLACEGEYDLVLLDLMLPGVDGFGGRRGLQRGDHFAAGQLGGRLVLRRGEVLRAFLRERSAGTGEGENEGGGDQGLGIHGCVLCISGWTGAGIVVGVG